MRSNSQKPLTAKAEASGAVRPGPPSADDPGQGAQRPHRQAGGQIRQQAERCQPFIKGIRRAGRGFALGGAADQPEQPGPNRQRKHGIDKNT